MGCHPRRSRTEEGISPGLSVASGKPCRASHGRELLPTRRCGGVMLAGVYRQLSRRVRAPSGTRSQATGACLDALASGMIGSGSPFLLDGSPSYNVLDGTGRHRYRWCGKSIEPALS